MAVELRSKLGGASQDRAAWLVLLLLLLGVLAPTACVLWLMNEAARSQAVTARQSVNEAYRGQLRLIRDRVDAYWLARAAALEAGSGAGAAADFQRVVSSGLSDSAIFLNPDGALPYSTPVAAVPNESLFERPEWNAAEQSEIGRDRLPAAAEAYRRIAESASDPSVVARAAQGQIRCLLRSGDKQTAIHVIRERFLAGPAARGMDSHGRLIAADELLLALRLLKADDRRYPPAVASLAGLLNDYGAAIPAAQRLFLMEELGGLPPGPATPALPTYGAERLAAQFLETGGPHAGERAFERTRIPDVWKLTSASGGLIALFRTGTVLSATRSLLDARNPSPSVRFVMTPPGAAAVGDSTPAGFLLPGWQISFSLLDNKPFDDMAHRRMASYVWVGCLAIAVMALTGLIAGQALRRQWRLARLKTDLVATVSHELKTPLASMRLLVDALLEDEAPDATKTREYLELIARENVRLSRVIGNFLTFSRLERNRQKFDFAATRADAVVESAIESARERLHAPECHLEVNVSPGLPPVRADEDALVTVLLNLLDNAWKYTPGEKRIGVRAYAQDGRVIFAVEDNGIGIAPRERKRIFRRFYQVDRRLTRDTGGCGLGLSIVEFIVRAHGGSIEVESQPGRGSTFSVAIPEAV